MIDKIAGKSRANCLQDGANEWCSLLQVNTRQGRGLEQFSVSLLFLTDFLLAFFPIQKKGYKYTKIHSRDSQLPCKRLTVIPLLEFVCEELIWKELLLRFVFFLVTNRGAFVLIPAVSLLEQTLVCMTCFKNTCWKTSILGETYHIYPSIYARTYSSHLRLLPIYPSQNLTFCPKREVSVNVRFEKGQVDSFPETYIDPFCSLH